MQRQSAASTPGHPGSKRQVHDREAGNLPWPFPLYPCRCVCLKRYVGPVHSSSPATVYEAVRDSAVEFLILFGLWMLFVSQTQTNEIVAGIAAALIGAVADGVLKAEGYAKFKPRFKWLLLITWEVWYVLAGTWAVMLALARRMVGMESQAQFRAVKFEAGGDDAESWARRSLVTAYMTIPPDSIILGVDRNTKLMLVHEIAPRRTPEIARRLGAES